MNVGIVGYGTVGKAMECWLSPHTDHQVMVYDKYLADWSDDARRRQINKCDLVFVAVPTLSAADGMTCDTSAVEEVVSWVTAPICIKSTVAPGTTDRLSALSGKQIAFSPEYVGEASFHPWREIEACGFVIVGGSGPAAERTLALYQSVLGPSTPCYRTTAIAAEICKYMENCFLATKVAFVNQFFDIATAFGVGFEELRGLWLADSRIGESHTRVTEERGFGGRCLPKDMRAMIAAMAPFGGAPLLESVMVYNELIRQPSSPTAVHGTRAVTAGLVSINRAMAPANKSAEL